MMSDRAQTSLLSVEMVLGMLPPPPQGAEALVRHCARHAVPKALDTRKLRGVL